jgi:type I restriction enzyme S subunit
VSATIPQGWHECRLENCVEVLDSLRVPVNNVERQSRIEGKTVDQLYPYYGATGKVGVIDDFLFDEELVALGEDGVPFLDPLKQKAYMLHGKAWVNNHAHVLRGFDGVAVNKFVFYYLNQFNYQGYVNGGTRLKLTQASMRAIPIALPPLAEQVRIAAKLDELLAQVDTLKARIDGIPVLLKRFRQSVLAAAVSGRLTRESYDSLSGTYALEPLGKLVAEPLRNGKSVKDGIGQRVLRLSALKKNSIDFFESKAGNWTGINFEQYIVKNDDFLISRGNGSKALVGRGGLARHVTNNVAYPDTMIRVRPDTQKLLPKFLATVWNSQLVRRQIESTARTTAGIWKISQGDLEVLKIPLPSLVEQREIVRSVEQLFAYTDHLETKIASAKSRIDHLTQSILTKAFRGELVPQDPNDEPAGALLDRIKAQRATAPKAKRGRQAATLG